MLSFLLALATAAFGAQLPVTFDLDGWTAVIEPGSMTVRARVGGREMVVARGAGNAVVELSRGRAQAAWRVPAMSATFRFEVRGRRLGVRIASEKEQTLAWPRTGGDAAFTALILPQGEGLYVPLRDAVWVPRLAGKCFSPLGQLSMPFWSYAFAGGTFTYQLLSDLRSELCADNSLAMTASNKFLDHDALPAFELEMWPGGASPIAPALEYRAGLKEFVPLQEKIRANPNVERLLGAIHMYVWGDGRTPAFLDELRAAGAERAVVCYAGAVEKAFPSAAKTAGYLVGPYDSYANAQDPKTTQEAASRWPGDLYPAGCIVNREGKRKEGFAGRGCELSSQALEQSPLGLKALAGRLRDRLQDGANAYFLDVDAFGELHDDYSPAHSMTAAVDRANRLRRMRRVRASGVVLGSEEGVGWSVPVIDFAHGALSVQNNFLWPKKKEFGGWWPPARPRIFFQQVDPGAEFASAKYDPAYRVPLYEAAFHSAVVATDRWDVPLAKFPSLMMRRQLLELLYGVPSMWAMDRQQLKQSRDTIAKLTRFFTPVHKQLGAAPLTSFEWLTADRLVQRTVFGNAIELTANFGSVGFTQPKPGCIVARWLKTGELRTLCP